ncbi:unnamed protein product, partial [Rotaria sp. Silwood1]
MLIDFSPAINGGPVTYEEPCICDNLTAANSTEEEGGVDYNTVIVNKMYIGVIHVISATLYWWAWKDHRWNDVIMLPEYLNH